MTIGDFARLGQVSVRMLRHYDSLGLLRPAHVEETEPPEGAELVDLPAAETVCGVHLGPMAGVQETWQEMHRWIADNGYAFVGPCRELCVRAESNDQADWVTELQQPVVRS